MLEKLKFHHTEILLIVFLIIIINILYVYPVIRMNLVPVDLKRCTNDIGKYDF